MRYRVLGLLATGMLVACSSGSQPELAKIQAKGVDAIDLAQPATHASAMADDIRVSFGRSVRTSFASLPDRGDLVAYDRTREVRRSGAYIHHPVRLSEAHALHAIGPGKELVLTAPDGHPIRLRYETHIEHEDGNWTWVGRRAGAPVGNEAVITFGEKAVFGQVPDGDNATLKLDSAAGKAWLVEADRKLLAAMGDAQWKVGDSPLLRDANGAPIKGSLGTARAPATLDTSRTPAPVVDVLLGYTPGVLAKYGGRSQVLTNLHNMVDVGNVAFRSSEVPGRIRMVHAMEVDYPDASSNQGALQELSGFTCREPGCSPTPIPAALQPLHSARDTYGADLVSLVRVYDDATSGNCGAAWLIGGGRVEITSDDSVAGMSVVAVESTTNKYPCQITDLVHELAHNMGSAHDRDAADGDNNLLEDNEYGRYDYSFGFKFSYSYDPKGTVMAYGVLDFNRRRFFSGPNVKCELSSSFICGNANADNVRSLTNTMPVIATFRASSTAVRPVARNDFSGDGRSDFLWHNPKISNPDHAWWTMNANQVLHRYTWRDKMGWTLVATGDFDGDGRADAIWRRTSDGRMVLESACYTLFCGTKDRYTPKYLVDNPGAGWQPAGAGDIDGDGRADLLWLYDGYVAGNVQYWLMGGAQVVRKGSLTMTAGYRVATTGDFNGDRKLDIVWRDGASNSYRMWLSNPTGFTGKSFLGPGTGWQPVGAGDVDKDGKSDLVWFLPQNVPANFRYWLMDGSTRVGQKSYTQAPSMVVVAMGDYDANGMLDVVWRYPTSPDVHMWLNIGGNLSAKFITTGLNSNWKLLAGN